MCSSNIPLSAMGRVLFCNPSLITGTIVVMAHWWFHSCYMVMQPASQLQVNLLLLASQGKCNIVQSALGHVADCWRVVGMVAVCEQGYWMLKVSDQYWMHEVPCYHGPHIGCQFLVTGFHLPFSWKGITCIGSMELKTLTFLMLFIINYLILWL